MELFTNACAEPASVLLQWLEWADGWLVCHLLGSQLLSCWLTLWKVRHWEAILMVKNNLAAVFEV